MRRKKFPNEQRAIYAFIVLIVIVLIVVAYSYF
jgi:hypothetical protein